MLHGPFDRIDATTAEEPRPLRMGHHAYAGDEPDGAPFSPPRPRVRLPWFRLLRAGLVLGLLALFVAVAWLAITAPLSRSLKPLAPPSVTLLAADGRVIARRGAVIGRPVSVAQLPADVPHAFLAIEDRRFYSHWGIDPHGILRAAWHNLRAGGVREGGSTITQQLAKLAFLDSDRTAARKAKEVLIAFWLEAWLSKDEILSRYLSTVYFGDNVYGLDAAARHYFSKPPRALTLGEAAMLAGLMKAPSRLAPSTNLAGARARARLVVAAMVDAGFVTPARARAARPARLDLLRAPEPTAGTYFADWVLADARARMAANPGAGDRIVTTLDARLQRAAELAVARAGTGPAQAALVAMRPDGRVVAMVGGRRYSDSAFNRATQARRQPGSTFKLFVYLAAIRAGMTPDSTVEDTPLRIGKWAPANADGRYRGRITLREAFARSSNVAAVRLTREVGPEAVVRAARDLGITSPLAADPSIALGTSSVTLVELASAYAAVAGGDYPVHAHGLPETPEAKGWLSALWSARHRLSDRERGMLLDLLSATVTSGTARGAALDRQVYGKTGTTQGGRDALFVGFADGLVTAVWVGRDDNQPLRGMAGGGLPARLWRGFMAEALGAHPLGHAVPDSVDPDTGIDLDLGNLSEALREGRAQLDRVFDDMRGVEPAEPPEPADRDDAPGQEEGPQGGGA